MDAHDEAMEVVKDLQRDCPAVTLTVKADATDYAVALNRESKQKRGLLRTNSQIMVANRAGWLASTNDLRWRSARMASVDNCAPKYFISLSIVRPIRFRDLRSLTIPPKPPPSTVEARELEADHEAAPVLQKYLELADIALGVPSLGKPEKTQAKHISYKKRAA